MRALARLCVALALAAATAVGAQEPFGRPAPMRPTQEEAPDEEAEPLPPRSDARLVTLAGLDGELAAPGRAARFLAAFHRAFAADEFRAERGGGAGRAWKPAGRVRNRFRLHEGDEAKDAWTVSVVADSLRDPPAGLAGVRLLIAILSPQAAKMNARPLPLREDLAFDAGPLGPDFAAAAGRVVALRVLERLHQLDGQLDDRARLAWPGRASGFVKRGVVE